MLILLQNDSAPLMAKFKPAAIKILDVFQELPNKKWACSPQ